MRFKAHIINPTFLANIVKAVDKISKHAVLRIGQKKFQFILQTDVSDGVQVWSGLNTSTVFEDMTLESLSNNEVSFSINLENLLCALKSCQNAQETVVKLTKKNGNPFLELITVKHATQPIQLIQDVPITLLTGQQLAALVEPHLPDPQVHIMLPPLKLLRSVIDRMKNMSEHLFISANMGGELRFSIDTNSVSVTTAYAGLEHPLIEGRTPPQHDRTQKGEAQIEIKKFAKFLFSSQVSPTNVILCLVEGRAIVLHVLVDDLYLTYYIPVILQ
jgi:HUS1 checkpoint protein